MELWKKEIIKIGSSAAICSKDIGNTLDQIIEEL